MITVCSYCTRIQADDGSWVYAHILPDEEKSHGCCPECYDEQQAEVDKFEERMAAVREEAKKCSDG